MSKTFVLFRLELTRSVSQNHQTGFHGIETLDGISVEIFFGSRQNHQTGFHGIETPSPVLKNGTTVKSESSDRISRD